MNTSQHFYTANATGGKAAPSFPITSPDYTYSLEEQTYDTNFDSGDATTLFMPEFDLTTASPFTQAFCQPSNALGLKNDRFARAVEAQPVLPTHNAEELDIEAYFAAIEGQPALSNQTQSQSHLHSSGSSDSLHSYNPGEIISRAYARSNSGSPSPSHTPSTTTPSQRSYSLSPHTTTCLPPNAFQSVSNPTISPVQLHSMSLSPSHSRMNSHAHSRNPSTQSIREITAEMQNNVQISQGFAYPVTPQDGPVALPRIAGHHRSRSIPMLNPLNTVDALEASHPMPTYLPIQQQYQYQAQPQYKSPQDQLSAAVAYPQDPQYLSAVSQTFSNPYLLHSDMEDGASPASGAEESGSSMYSPMVSYGHGRNLSTSTSGGSPFGNQQNLSPLSRGGSTGAVALPAATYAASNGMAVDSGMYRFSPVAQGELDASTQLKRKRSTEAEYEEYDDEDGDASYDGGSPSADDDDTDYSDESESAKGKKRKNNGHARRPSKRQNTLSGDWDIRAFGESSYGASTSTSPIQMKSKRSGSGSPIQPRKTPKKAPKLPEGAGIKVHKLPPIAKTDKSCPICSHVPGNGRYSDLLRHAKTHLHVPEHYVCATCSIVERNPDDGLLEFVEGEVFTRKDSCRRHWGAKHNPTGNLKWEERFCIVVDRVKKAGDSPSSSSSSIPNFSNISNVPYAPNSSFTFPY